MELSSPMMVYPQLFMSEENQDDGPRAQHDSNARKLYSLKALFSLRDDRCNERLTIVSFFVRFFLFLGVLVRS